MPGVARSTRNDDRMSSLRRWATLTVTASVLLAACGSSDDAADEEAVPRLEASSSTTTAASTASDGPLPSEIAVVDDIQLDREIQVLVGGDRLQAVESPRQAVFFGDSLHDSTRTFFGAEDEAVVVDAAALDSAIYVLTATGSLLPGPSQLRGHTIDAEGGRPVSVPPGDYALRTARGRPASWINQVPASVAPLAADGTMGDAIPIDGVTVAYGATEADGTVWVSAPEERLLIGLDAATGAETSRIELPLGQLVVGATTPGVVWLESAAGPTILRVDTATRSHRTIALDLDDLNGHRGSSAAVHPLGDDLVAVLVGVETSEGTVAVVTTVDAATSEQGPVRLIGDAPARMATVGERLFVLHGRTHLLEVDVTDLRNPSRDDDGTPLTLPGPATPTDAAEQEVLGTFNLVYQPHGDRATALGAVTDAEGLEPAMDAAFAATAAADLSIESAGVWIDGATAWAAWFPVGADGERVAATQVALLRRTDGSWVVDRDRLCHHYTLIGVTCATR